MTVTLDQLEKWLRAPSEDKSVFSFEMHLLVHSCKFLCNFSYFQFVCKCH